MFVQRTYLTHCVFLQRLNKLGFVLQFSKVSSKIHESQSFLEGGLFHAAFQWIHPPEFRDTTHVFWMNHRQFLTVKLLLDLHSQNLFKISIHFIF